MVASGPPPTDAAARCVPPPTAQKPTPCRPSCRRCRARNVTGGSHDALLGASAADHVSWERPGPQCLAPGPPPLLPPATRAVHAPRDLSPAGAPRCRFREALEAAVVVSVLLQMVEKMKMPQLKKHGAPRGSPLVADLGGWLACCTQPAPPAASVSPSQPPSSAASCPPARRGAARQEGALG